MAETGGRYLYDKIIRSGIALIAAAGNDSYNGYNFGTNELPASLPTYSTICTPSSSGGALSVASSVPDDTYYNKTYFVFNGNSGKAGADMIYSDLSFEDVYGDDLLLNRSRSDDSQDDDEVMDKVGYIYIDGIGKAKDFEENDVGGKIAIFNESSISINKLVKYAVKYNCYAAAVIRNEKDSGLPSGTEPSDFFVYAIDSSAKGYLQRHPEGTVTIKNESELSARPEAKANTVTEYSSYGTTADLSLKPDITAPGDDVLSSVPGQSYSLMSGTSMSSPCMTGAYAIFKQYLTENGILMNMSPSAAEEYIYTLLMSGADPIGYDGASSLWFSPRVQGAGLVDFEKAMSLDAYLSVDGKRPSVSLKEIEDGSFEFSFTVTNISEKELEFTPVCILQPDGYRLNEDTDSEVKYINPLEPVNIRSRAEIAFEVDGADVGSIMIPPLSDVEVKVTGAIDPVFISSYQKYFTNGFFADGFVYLRGENTVSLNMPFSGFCGSWLRQRIFPDDIYSSDPKSYPYYNSVLKIVSSFNPDSTFSETAGVNIFGFTELPSIISFGSGSLRSYLDIPDEVYTTSSVLLPSLFLQREALDYTISFFDKKGTLLFCQNFGRISSYMSYQTTPDTFFTEDQKKELINNYYNFAETLEEGNYTYMLSASTVGADGNAERTESVAFRVNVDNTKPRINDYYLEKTDDGKLYLNVYATDNNYLQGIRLSAIQYDDKGKVVSKTGIYDEFLQYLGSGASSFAEYDYDLSSRMYHFRYDLTRYKKFINEKISGSGEVYKDDDLEIIFEDEKDYSNVCADDLLIEAVDCAHTVKPRYAVSTLREDR